MGHVGIPPTLVTTRTSSHLLFLPWLPVQSGATLVSPFGAQLTPDGWGRVLPRLHLLPRSVFAVLLGLRLRCHTILKLALCNRFLLYQAL